MFTIKGASRHSKSDTEFDSAYHVNSFSSIRAKETQQFEGIRTTQRPVIFQLLVILYRVRREGKAGPDAKINQILKLGREQYVRSYEM